MGDSDTGDLTTEISKVIDEECRAAYLADNIGPAINDGGADKLRPDHEDQGHVVDPSVDAVKEVVTEFCAVG